jgi:hypothetical protein
MHPVGFLDFDSGIAHLFPSDEASPVQSAVTVRSFTRACDGSHRGMCGVGSILFP